MNKLIKNYKYIFISTFILLFLVHFNLLTTNIISGDILLNNFFYKGYSWEVSLGRFGLWVVGLLKGYLSIPIIDLSISFIIISIITCILIDMFEVKNKLNRILIILMMVISPIMSSTLLFHYCSIGYLLALLSSCLSVYLFYKLDNKLKYILPIILIVIALSMYQAYLSVITTLFVLYNIKLILNKKYNYKDVLKYLLILFSGIVIYFILMKLSLKVFHIDMSTYSDADKIGINTILSIPSKIINSYKLFIDYYLFDEIIKNSYFHNYIFNSILFILMFMFIIKDMINNKIKTSNKVLIIVLLLLLPVFLNSVIFVTYNSKLQLLMAMSYLLIPIFIFSFDTDKIFKYIIIFTSVILLRNYYIQDQCSYLSLNYTFNSYNTIIRDSIKDNYNKKFMFIGSINNSDKSIYKMNYGFISDDPIFWEEYNLKKIGFCKYVEYYLGLDVEFVDSDTYNLLIKDDYSDVINYRDDYVIIDFDNI